MAQYNQAKSINITKNETLIILDWDNTLFPTSWVIQNKIDIKDPEVSNKYIVYFYELDSVLHNLLSKLLDYGNVIIVTNALPSWVKISSSVLPKTNYLLNKIKVVSARKNYQSHSSNMMDWKRLAFKDEVSREMLNKKIMNIISIGDAEYEYKALIDLYNLSHKPKLLKSIRFVDEPSHETLIDQLEVLNRASDQICHIKKHLDLKFKFYSNYR
jgi:hypothetical protein